MSPPDVSVLVPVYNTMPYLTRCLNSLVGQTIGPDRMQIVAVDDGSTDGSGRVLDRYARRHPGPFTVIHQANSGGPAGPCNRALDLATGRYVFFVGADDWLGRDALRRLVAAADDYESDVVLGKVVGVNSRHIHQDIFARDQVDIDLANSPLPRSLGNTKLFRRDLLDRYGLRYREDMPIASDQPFTLEACYRARRITVLADYVYYYAVRRLTATNVTYLSQPLERLRTAEAVLTFAAELIESGPQRAAVLLHYFDHNVARLLGDDFLGLDRATQQRLHDGIGRLVAAHLSDDIAARLGAEARIRTAMTRHGDLVDLLAVIRQDADVGVPDTVIDGDRRFARYPGFRDPTRQLPESCFDVTTASDWPAKLDATSIAWGSVGRGARVLTVTARTPVPDLGAFGVDVLTANAEEIPAVASTVARGSMGTAVQIRLGMTDLLAASNPTGQRRCVTARVGDARGADQRSQAGSFDLDGSVGTASASGAAPVRAPRLRRMRPRICRRGARWYAVGPVVDGSGHLMISVVPLTPRRFVARVRDLMRRRAR
jgi:poly(ribitol-phosphate) beta-N-acetylglucosaminyltransferase